MTVVPERICPDYVPENVVRGSDAAAVAAAAAAVGGKQGDPT